MRNFDFLVIGGGIAGLTYALKVAQHGEVAVLFKKELEDSSTSWAQGGIAAVTDKEDSFDLHIEDTLVAGAGLCKREVVEVVVREGPERVAELVALGAKFDRQNPEQFHLHREGGHSKRRIYHSADATGTEIQRALLTAARENKRIHLFNHSHAIDLITTYKLRRGLGKRNRALGAYVLMPDSSVEVFLAPKILVATGGAGKVYLYTSNPDVATGDGVAMCFRAGARVGNLEFFQFHPTCLYHPKAKTFLIAEAMRGEGAILRRINGQAFMERHHPLKELAPRDIVARAIDHEMKAHGEDFVYLDISHRGKDFVTQHFPTIYERCLQYGVDIGKEPIPVVPAAHYCCGGVLTDQWACSDIQDLYVAGECAQTGLHGANRLASNSLLEGMVFAHRAALHSIEHKNDTLAVPDRIAPWDSGAATDSDEQVVITQNWDEIRRFMWNYVGIVRTTKRLERALARSQAIQTEINEYYWNFKVTPDLLELRNLSLVAELVIRSAMKRRESRGLHFTLDYPQAVPELAFDTVIAPGDFSVAAT